MRTYYVYMILCVDGTYYTGVTNNIERRFRQHRTGYNAGSYTYFRRPLKLVYTQTFNRILEAIAFEKQLKKWSKAKKEALIRGDFEEIKKLAKKKFKR